MVKRKWQDASWTVHETYCGSRDPNVGEDNGSTMNSDNRDQLWHHSLTALARQRAERKLGSIASVYSETSSQPAGEPFKYTVARVHTLHTLEHI